MKLKGHGCYRRMNRTELLVNKKWLTREAENDANGLEVRAATVDSKDIRMLQALYLLKDERNKNNDTTETVNKRLVNGVNRLNSLEVSAVSTLPRTDF